MHSITKHASNTFASDEFRTMGTRTTNITKITRLAIPRFWSNVRSQILPIKWRHECERSQKISPERAPFWAPSWLHLMGKTSFPWSSHIGPKPGNSQPCYFSNVEDYLIYVVQNVKRKTHFVHIIVYQNLALEFTVTCVTGKQVCNVDPSLLNEQLPVSVDCWPNCASNHLKIMVVRHPLERFLSAYRYVFDSKYDF